MSNSVWTDGHDPVTSERYRQKSFFMEIYLSLGSNLGDRRHNLEEALYRLDLALGRHYDAVSDFIYTEPWGFESSDWFLNAAVRYCLDVPRGTDVKYFAHNVLRKCKLIEVQMGRTGGPEYDSGGNRVYHSRIIDIDILLVDDVHINDDDLKIPHPLMFERDFVMIPLRQILNV